MDYIARLVRTFAPAHYDLSVTLERTERKFNGTVSITGTSSQDANDIRLHAKDLDISSVRVDGKNAQYFVNEADELIITHDDIQPGKHVVVASFSGAITDDMNGVYPCYFEVAGEKKELIATQFESHFARQVFPCVDEPEAKATFDVTLTTETGVTVLGNMPIKSQKIENGSLVTHFDTTPRMSSYLLAWVVGELHKKTAVTKRGVEVSVWATKAHSPESLDFGLNIATRTIDFFEEYFGVEYPLPKSDNVALPDFSSGAMENWGLITYREIALLVDPKTTSLPVKQHAALTIAHELSHQWFGNLVTMKWWNDLWLNESFANMMEYVAIDALEPGWDIWLEQASNEVVSALRRDSLDGVQSIQIEVHHPDEISSIFDPSIVYAKGGRLLRMLQAYIGEPAMRSGLKKYFQAHALQNTEANDLWNALGKSSGKDVAGFMGAWMTQPGYPVVHTSASGRTIRLQQEQFFIGPHKPSDRLWPIPLHANSRQAPDTLEGASVEFTYTENQPFRLNKDSTAHFVTHYDPELYQAIVKDLPNLSKIDRLGFIHEQTLLAQSGVQSTAAHVPLLQNFTKETDEAVWGNISIAIGELRRFVENDEQAEVNLKKFVRELTDFNYQRLGWDKTESESENDTKLRSTIISLALYAENEDAMQNATDRYINTPITELDNELRTAIMVHAVRTEVTSDIADTLIDTYKSSSNSELRDDIASALTATRSEALIKKLSSLLKDSSLIRPQDFTHWYVWMIRNRYGRDFMWKWTQSEWPWLEATFKNDSHYDMLPRYIAGALKTAEQLSQYETFFEAKKNQAMLSRNITIGLTDLRGRVELLKRDTKVVCEALRNLY